MSMHPVLIIQNATITALETVFEASVLETVFAASVPEIVFEASVLETVFETLVLETVFEASVLETICCAKLKQDTVNKILFLTILCNIVLREIHMVMNLNIFCGILYAKLKPWQVSSDRRIIQMKDSSSHVIFWKRSVW